ncbi:ABC transporter substrate-binding protein [Sphingomonas sp. RT2P30]|uniref:ABC transporter substrate-binding protein n=1 Tax=Parasphingomonas halimpatiens TaxID=3096162 RepID=UPI002FC741DF
MLCSTTSALLIAVALVASGAGHAQAVDPADPIRALTTVLAGQGARAPAAEAVRAAVERSFDVEGLARGVLAGLAAGATPRQLDRFRRALAGRIARDLRGRLRTDQRWTLDIVQTREIGPEEWLETSRVTVSGKGARTIAWRVRSAGGKAVIVDVLGNGTSMIRTLHNDYDAALRRFGLDGVIDRMEASTRVGRG